MPTPVETPTTDDRADEPITPAALLAELEIAPRDPMTGYERDDFGYRAVDLDRNGCDTRNDILGRDLREIVHKPGTGGCVVESGILEDPYSGATIVFARGTDTSNDVQIDHVVSLGNAWVTGAQGWDTATMQAFGNDPLNLLAVDGPLNSQKGDGDAATWLPPNKPYRCTYAALQITVKHTYGLWVTPPEHEALTRILSRCPDQPAITAVDDVAPTEPATADADPIPTPTPEPSTSETADGGEVYYENCAAVRAAGADPIREGDPGWSPRFDGDGDGIGCE